MVFLKILVAMLLFSSDSDDKFSELIEKATADNATVRGKAVLELGAALGSITDLEQQKTAAETLIDAIADRVELVSHSARLRMAEHPALINKHLGPYFEKEGFTSFGKACETIKVVGADARIWLPQLMKELAKDDRNFKLAALHAMRALDGKDLLPALDETIKALDHKDFNVQLSACRVIEKIGPEAKKAGPRLVKLLEEGIASARSWAGVALGAIGPHEDYDVVKLLEERLDRFYLVDRERALIGLAHLGDKAKSVVPKIETLMEQRSKSVQHVASRTHWKVTGDPAKAIERLTTLIPTMEFGAESMDILGEMGPDAKAAVPVIIKQLESEEFPAREAAVYALASMGSVAKSAIEPLKRLAKTERDHLIRAATEMAIEKINGEQEAEK